MAIKPSLDAAQIVCGAAELADAVGFDQFTFRELAAKLGVKPPSLYNHVASLEAVHRGLALRAMQDLADVMRASAVGRRGLDALRGIAYAERDFAHQHPGLFAALQRTFEDQDEELRLASHDLLNVVLAVLDGYPLKGDERVHAARALRAALTGFVLLESNNGFGMPTGVDQSFDWLIVMLDAGLKVAKTSNFVLTSAKN